MLNGGDGMRDQIKPPLKKIYENDEKNSQLPTAFGYFRDFQTQISLRGKQSLYILSSHNRDSCKAVEKDVKLWRRERKKKNPNEKIFIMENLWRV
jgi:hypothetical protein